MCMCMCAWARVHARVCMLVRACACARVHACARACVRMCHRNVGQPTNVALLDGIVMFAHRGVHACTHACAHMSTSVRERVRAFVRVCMLACVLACVCACAASEMRCQPVGRQFLLSNQCRASAQVRAANMKGFERLDSGACQPDSNHPRQPDSDSKACRPHLEWKGYQGLPTTTAIQGGYASLRRPRMSPLRRRRHCRDSQMACSR